MTIAKTPSEFFDYRVKLDYGIQYMHQVIKSDKDLKKAFLKHEVKFQAFNESFNMAFGEYRLSCDVNGKTTIGVTKDYVTIATYSTEIQAVYNKDMTFKEIQEILVKTL